MVMSVEMEVEQSSVSHMKVLHRAHQLPLVNKAATYIHMAYTQAKDYSQLVNITLNMAENGAKLAGRAATPVMLRLDGNIHRVDDIACQALTALENRYPLIGKNTEEVSACILDAGAGVRNGAVAQAGALLESTPGQVALMGLTGYLIIANKLADVALPADLSQPSMCFESSNVALNNVAELSDKLYRRVKTLSLAQLQQLQELSNTALTGIHYQLTLLDVVKVSLERYTCGVKDSAVSLLQHVHSSTESLQQQTLMLAQQITQQLTTTYAAVNQRTLQLASSISSQLQSMYEAVSLTKLPHAVHSALLAAKSHAHTLYTQLSQVKSVDDLTTLTLSQIRESMNLLQSSVSSLFQAVAPVKNTLPDVTHVTESCQSSTKSAQETEKHAQETEKPAQESETVKPRSDSVMFRVAHLNPEDI